MKRPLLVLILSILMVVPTYSLRAANFVAPQVAQWQAGDAMRQMMVWFSGGSSRNNYQHPWLPFGSLYSTPYVSDLNDLTLLGINLSPEPYEENLRVDEPNLNGGDSRNDQWVPAGENHLSGRSGYEGIDGIWRINTGERWTIEGNQFALRHANGAITRGQLLIEGDWISIRYDDSDMTVSLQFRQMDNLLLIRDRSGAIMLLHRIVDARPSVNRGGINQ